MNKNLTKQSHRQPPKITGRVKRNPDGFGFLIPDDPEFVDVYIPRHEMTKFGVMTDDRITALCHRERDDRYSGQVTEVIERSMKQVVGRYHKGVIIDEGRAWGQNLEVKLGAGLKAEDGQLVAVRILTYPDDRAGFVGEVVEVLGEHGDPLLDTKQILYENHVPMEFSKETLRSVAAIPEDVTEKDWQGRKDLRAKKFVTIDGATARDFDDAVYAEKEHDGFRVWVAIADVSYYVKEGTALDNDAYQRGTSVYFPDMVVPMLPEKLSNGLCSLNPHVPRLAMVAEMKLNHHGDVVDSDFYEAVFMSHHRMIYGEVEDIINGFDNPKYKDVISNIKLMGDIANILMKKRFREGSLDLEIPEAQLVIDATGVPVDVVRGDRLFAHRLIEELMLMANVAVARFIEKNARPSLYRVHEDPFPDALKSLELMAHNWGLKIRLAVGKKDDEKRAPRGQIQKQLMKMLEHVKGKPEEHILSIFTLRSMKQAQYSNENKGHFGLAFDCYTHFTSPIRRYPDLVVHRVLRSIFNANKGGRHFTEEDMAVMGTFLSACEQRANKSERDLISIKKCRFMERHVGETLEGMVTGIHKFGVFVQLRAYDIDGLVRFETIRGDRIRFDEQSQTIIGKNIGVILRLGDHIQVNVMRSDPEARQIDFEWVDQKHAPKGAKPNALDFDRPPNRPNVQKRCPTETNSGGVRQAWLSQRGGKSKAGAVHSKKNNKKRRARKSHSR